MFLRMFKKSDRVAVKKAQPAAVTLTEMPRKHPFSGLFAVKAQKTYAGRQAFLPDIKTLEPAAAAPKSKAKAKSIEGLPEIHASLTQMLSHLKDVAGTVASLNTRLDAVESDKDSVDKTLKSLEPFIGHIRGGDSIIPGKVNTLKSEIDNIAHLLATATGHREVSALRQQLLIKSNELDALEQSTLRKSIKESACSSELQLLRGFLVGSGIECRRGV